MSLLESDYLQVDAGNGSEQEAWAPSMLEELTSSGLRNVRAALVQRQRCTRQLTVHRLKPAVIRCTVAEPAATACTLAKHLDLIHHTKKQCIAAKCHPTGSDVLLDAEASSLQKR
eukprot:1160440-Pelagomonas_calceolata.AAC.3